MLHKLHKFHPGLVGAAVGFSMGALYSTWWLGLKSVDVGLSDAKTMWLLVVTVVVIVCFPLLMTYDLLCLLFVSRLTNEPNQICKRFMEHDCRDRLFP